MVSSLLLFAPAFIPIFGAGLVLNMFTVVPILVAGIISGRKSAVIAAMIPTLLVVIFAGNIEAFLTFTNYFLPSLAALYWLLLTAAYKKQKVIFYNEDFIVNKFLLSIAVIMCLLIIITPYIINASFTCFSTFFTRINPNISINMIHAMPGIISIFYVIMHWIYLKLAYKIAIKHFTPIRSLKNLYKKPINILPIWDIVCVFGLIIAILGEIFKLNISITIVGKSLAIFSSLPLFIKGLGIFKLLTSKNLLMSLPQNKWLMFLLGIVAFLLVWPLFIIVLLGFVEPWYGKIKK